MGSLRAPENHTFRAHTWGHGAPPKQNDNTCFHRQCYMMLHAKTHIYIYIHIHMQKSVLQIWLELKNKAGSAQRLPPKQNDNTCFHRQCCSLNIPPNVFIMSSMPLVSIGHFSWNSIWLSFWYYINWLACILKLFLKPIPYPTWYSLALFFAIIFGIFSGNICALN